MRFEFCRIFHSETILGKTLSEKGNVILGPGSGDDSNGDRSMGGGEEETLIKGSR